MFEQVQFDGELGGRVVEQMLGYVCVNPMFTVTKFELRQVDNRFGNLTLMYFLHKVGSEANNLMELGKECGHFMNTATIYICQVSFINAVDETIKLLVLHAASGNNQIAKVFAN